MASSDSGPGFYYYGQPEKELVLPNPELNADLQPSGSRLQGLPMVDLRTEFNSFMKNYGQMVLLQRMNLKIHCPYCWNDKLGEGDPQCGYCLGRGYLSVLERHPSRKVSSLNEHRLQLLEQSATGPELIDEVFWYFEWNVNPQAEDMVYEVTWEDAAQTRPKQTIESDRITYSFGFRGIGGRIEYWRASTRSRPIDQAITSNNLRRISSRTLNIPEDGIVRYAGAIQ